MNQRKPYEPPAIVRSFPVQAPEPVRLQLAAGLIIAASALEEIRAALDADCDATGVALYNPRHTVAELRRILSRAEEQLSRVKL